jgi:hypothetical protein
MIGIPWGFLMFGFENGHAGSRLHDVSSADSRGLPPEQTDRGRSSRSPSAICSPWRSRHLHAGSSPSSASTGQDGGSPERGRSRDDGVSSVSEIPCSIAEIPCSVRGNSLFGSGREFAFNRLICFVNPQRKSAAGARFFEIPCKIPCSQGISRSGFATLRRSRRTDPTDLRYDLSPTCPGWTMILLVPQEGFEPPTPSLRMKWPWFRMGSPFFAMRSDQHRNRFSIVFF